MTSNMFGIHMHEYLITLVTFLRVMNQWVFHLIIVKQTLGMIDVN